MDTERTLYEIEVALAKHPSFDFRRTFNKLKKIKCKNKACAMYKEETE